MCLIVLLMGCGNKTKAHDNMSNKANSSASNNKTDTTNNANDQKTYELQAAKNDVGNIELSVIDSGNYKGSYVVVLPAYSSWANALWITTNEGNELVLEQQVTATDGMILSVKCVSLSQGDFIEVYDCSHKGNGGMKLISWDNLTKAKYEFYGKVDKYHEGYVGENVIDQFNLPTIYESGPGYGYSFIYNGGYLPVEYKDVNNDGYTDVVFSGIKELVKDSEGVNYDNDTIMAYIYEKEVYLYNTVTKQFDLSNKLSEEKIFKALQ